MSINPTSFARFPNWLTTAVVATFILLTTGGFIYLLYEGDGSLLRDVSFSHETITPNADGVDDVARIQYTLSRNATVAIYFEPEDNANPAAPTRHYFRRHLPRGAESYTVLFSGVVGGFTLPGDEIQGEILARLMPNGRYRWTITATDEQGRTESATGLLTIAEVSSALPDLRDFGVDKERFTPNRDGLDDRALIQYYLTKEAQVRVFLLTPMGEEIPIAATERNIPAGMPGRHYYDYEGGVDYGQLPPPDGIYEVVAVAEDSEGQRIRASATLEIALGGVPRADIFAPPAGDTFQVSATAVTLCDTLFFTLTVENHGNTPIRTTGPVPDTIYDSDWNYNTLGWHTESGAWRVAVGYENELSNYPFRWAIGRAEDLVEIDGQSYLLPGERALVTGGIRLVGPFGNRNPQPVWAGLIHEDVEIAQFNNRVDPKAILVDLPADYYNQPPTGSPCPARPIPTR